MQNTGPNLLTVSGVARELEVSEATVRNYARRGILEASRVSVVSRAGLEFIAPNRKEPD